MEFLITIGALLKQLGIVVPALIAGTTTITGLINGAFNVQKGWVRHVVTIVVAILAGVVTALSGGLTVFASMTYNVIFGAVCGLIAGCSSSGLIYDWNSLAKIIDEFYVLFGHPNPTVTKEQEEIELQNMKAEYDTMKLALAEAQEALAAPKKAASPQPKAKPAKKSVKKPNNKKMKK